jgi:hypothetical protein
MRGEDRDSGSLVSTRPHRRRAVASVLGSKDQLPLGQVEVALRSAVIGAPLQLHQILGWLIGALFLRVKTRPVLSSAPAALAAKAASHYDPDRLRCR